MNKQIILIFTPLKFYSHEDEDLFFEWLHKIKCIKKFQGIGKELHVYIASNLISFNDFKNLNSLFKRYKLKNYDQLKIFLNKNDQEPFI